ncbi:putative virulence factor [Nibrella viscosa]|uniref:Virulence factor n=1 Tax=Nibrella viscosa TaxID=1084524 RepID=A0ABP8KLB9_9BACT
MFSTLSQESLQLQDIIRRGTEWLTHYEEPEKRLSTIDELGKLRRRAKRLEQAARMRPAFATFGISQVGKSYLVSNLARIPGQSLLQIEAPGIPAETVRQIIGHDGPISFIDDINPVGGGTEATGVVTRFTTSHQNNEGGYLVRLLSQLDIVKTMAIGYQYNIINSSYPEKLTAEHLDQRLNRLESLRQAVRQPGMSEDDILDLRDYLATYFRGMDLIGTLRRYSYWEKVSALVQYLRPGDRWQLFAPLWHEDEFMTNLFSRLTQGLADLDFTAEVWVGLEAVAPQKQTIVDVMRLYEMDLANTQSSTVTVTTSEKNQVSLSRSVLTGLTAELVLPLPRALENHPDRRFLKHADILDFPGARSMEGSPEVVFQQERDVSKKMDPFLRGKVFYLFNTYNDSFGISSLLYCMHNMQSEVKGTLNINSMISHWVSMNVGRTTEEREKRERTLKRLVPEEYRVGVDRINPFFLVLTKINVEIDECDPKKTGRTDLYDHIWDKRLDRFFDKEFEKVSVDKWTRSWSGLSESFKNTFMIRDPRYCKLSYQVVDGVESYNPVYEPAFADMEQSFVNSEHIIRHFHDPLTAWYEATRPGRNGIDYLLKYLMPACHPAIKQEQIREALNQIRQEIGAALCHHYEGGSVDEKLIRARERRDQLRKPVGRLIREKKFGRFLATLTVAEQFTNGNGVGFWDRELVRQVMSQPDLFLKQSEAAGAPAASDDLDDLFIDDLLNLEPVSPVSAPKPSTGTMLATRYAESLLGQWVAQLKQLRTDRQFQQLFGLVENEVTMLADEVERSMERDSLKIRVANEVVPYIQQSENLEVVLTLGRATINDFVNTLGWSRVSAEDKISNKAVYQPAPNEVTPIYNGQLKQVPAKNELNPTVDDPARSLYSQWFSGFDKAFEYNVLREANLTDPEKARINGLLDAIIKELGYQCR